MSQPVYKASELILPVTIEYTRHRDNRGSLIAQATIIERKGYNLQTDDGNWLWWPTINHYNDVMVVEQLAASSHEER